MLSVAMDSLSFMVHPDGWAMHSECIQGHEWEAYVVLEQSSVTEHGIAYGARARG